MSALQFIANITGSLAWPGVVALAFLLIWFTAPRDQRASLIGRLRKAGTSGIELDDATRDVAVATAPEEASKTPNTQEGQQPRSPAPNVLPYDEETRRRIDRIIEAAARWGWVRAGGKASDFRQPLIAWTSHGATILRSSGRFSVSPGDTLSFGAGSFIDDHTGLPNTSAYNRTNYGAGSEDIEEPER